MSLQKVKITDLIKEIERTTLSFEITPDISEDSVIDNESVIKPLFYSVTWHAKSHQCKDYNIAPLRLAKFLSNNRKHVLLHITCDMMKKPYLDQLLILLQGIEICNLFVVLGEKYEPLTSDFKTSVELITYIRERTGNFFCIGVPGYPDQTSTLPMSRLKEKIDRGADFIITQAFFEASVYKLYARKCKETGISVPVIPGLFPFETYEQLIGFINLCKVKVSNHVLEYVEKEGVQGKDITKKLIKDMRSETQHIHLFTLNKLKLLSDLISF